MSISSFSSSNASMAASRQGTLCDGDHSSETIHDCGCKGKTKESKASTETKDGERSSRDSVFTDNDIPVSDPFSSGKVEHTTAEESSVHDIIKAKRRHVEDRFKDNPLGIGCWRWFCVEPRHLTNKAYHSEEKPLYPASDVPRSLEDNDEPKSSAPGFGHNGVCDTPGVALLKNGVNAVRTLARRRPTVERSEIEIFRSGFKLIKSRFGASKGQATKQSKGKLPEKNNTAAIEDHTEDVAKDGVELAIKSESSAQGAMH